MIIIDYYEYSDYFHFPMNGTQDGFDPNDVPHASFKSMTAEITSSMIPGATIHTKTLTEGFHVDDDVFNRDKRLVLRLSLLTGARRGPKSIFSLD